MTEKLVKHNWIKSVLINGVIATVVLLFTHMVYETNDDFVISSRIADGYSEVYFINYYYCLILTKIQSFTSVFNIHVIAQVFLSFVSFVCVLKLVLDNTRDKIVIAAACTLIVFLSIDHYTTVQFTKTAALVTIAGALTLIDALIKERNPFYYIIGFLLFFTGACIRVEGVIIAFGFTGIYTLAWMLDNRSKLREILFRRGIAFGLVIATIIAGSALLHIASVKANTRTPELEEYVKYNDLRTAVIDYSILNNYGKQKAEYDKAGLSENDVSLIKSWMFDYDGSGSPENLETIISINNQTSEKNMTVKKASKQFIKGLRSSLKPITPKGAQITILVLLGIWLIIAGNGASCFLVFLTGAATATLHVMLYYIERPAYRAFYVPTVCAAVFMIYALSEIGLLNRVKRIPGIVVIIMMIILVVPVYKNAVDTYNDNSKRIMSEEFVEFIESNNENFYVVGTREKKLNPSYMTPWKKPDTRLDANCMGTGSWGTLSPYLLDKLSAYGMDNPIKDLLYIPNAYYVGNKNIDRMAEYYNKWYPTEGKTVTMIKKAEVAGLNVWKPTYE